MRNARLKIEPLAPACGAEIYGVDLSESLDEAIIAEIREALLAHHVVFFRDQDLNPGQHKAFAARFGELQRHPMIRLGDEHPEVLRIVKEKQDRKNFGGDWHTDLSYLEKPALGSILYAREVPAVGGDTLFANMHLAYETLSPGLRAQLDGMRAVHSTSRSYGAGGRDGGYIGEEGSMPVAKAGAEHEVEHPVVRTHPETGRKALYVNEVFTTRFCGMSEAESRPLLEYLWRHAARPEFTCRFRWRAGSVAFWDNRSTQHYAINDYHGERREMHRVTVEGDRPT
jgi:taurine dioxygenase